MLIYATTGDLITNGWMTSAPANAEALLRQASNLVRSATRNDMYWVYPIPAGQPIPASAPAGNDPGKPSDVRISQAFNDATCQQVLVWATSGINPDAGLHGQTAIITSQSSEGVVASYATERSQEWLEEETVGLCDASMVILFNAGLAVNRPQLL